MIQLQSINYLFSNYICYGVPDLYTQNGIDDSDFVIFVTARPTTGSTLAWALTCGYDQYGRPIYGQINIGPNRLNPDDKRAFNEQLGITIHEITHSLGFSSSNFDNFYEYYGGPKRSYSSVVYTDNSGWKSTRKIITPKVVEIAKKHYNCHDWTNAGVELEDYGGSGTAGSHWEKRIMYNEYMTGIAARNPVFSEFTLALFEDMGYYKVNYSIAEPLKFGKNKGCTFIKESCKMWKGSKDYFCEGEDHCSYDLKDKSQCLLRTYFKKYIL